MSYIRNHRDANETPIVQALLAAGCSVDRLPGGLGRPDLLVGRNGVTHLLEVKMPGNKLEPDQLTWHRSWRGLPPIVVRTPEKALRAVGIAV